MAHLVERVGADAASALGRAGIDDRRARRAERARGRHSVAVVAARHSSQQNPSKREPRHAAIVARTHGVLPWPAIFPPYPQSNGGNGTNIGGRRNYELCSSEPAPAAGGIT